MEEEARRIAMPLPVGCSQGKIGSDQDRGKPTRMTDAGRSLEIGLYTASGLARRKKQFR
jgi:hypothetical protein